MGLGMAKGENENSQSVAGEAGATIASPVPLAALEDERRKRHRSETEAAELRGQLAGMRSATSHSPSTGPAEQADLSPSQLRQAIEAGKLTEDDADGIREQQLERRLTGKIESKLRGKLELETRQGRVAGEIARYKDAIPGLNDPDSKEFAQLRDEFQRLVALGDSPDDQRTELAAAQVAFGNLDKRQTIKANRPDSHVETGGGGFTDADADSRTSDGAPKGLTPRLRDHYRGRIEKGQYTGWDDPKLKSEIAFANTTPIAKRAQARAAA